MGTTRYRFLRRCEPDAQRVFPFGVAFERDGAPFLFVPAWRAPRPLNAQRLEELGESDFPTTEKCWEWGDIQSTETPVSHPSDLLELGLEQAQPQQPPPGSSSHRE